MIMMTMIGLLVVIEIVIAFIIIMPISRILRSKLLPTHFYFYPSFSTSRFVSVNVSKRYFWLAQLSPNTQIDRTLQLRFLASFSIRIPQFPKLLSPPCAFLCLLLFYPHLSHFICGCLLGNFLYTKPNAV